MTGALGPGRNFSPGQIYGNLLWFFLVGPVVVVITWLIGRRWKTMNYLSWPVAFGAMSLVPPATGISFSSWWVVNVVFNGWLKFRKPAWWSKYSMARPPGQLNFLYSRHPAKNCRLRPLSSPRLRRRRRHSHHLLLHHTAGRIAQLVGEYRVQ